jgi:hypothetical protein
MELTWAHAIDCEGCATPSAKAYAIGLAICHNVKLYDLSNAEYALECLPPATRAEKLAIDAILHQWHSENSALRAAAYEYIDCCGVTVQFGTDAEGEAFIARVMAKAGAQVACSLSGSHVHWHNCATERQDFPATVSVVGPREDREYIIDVVRACGGKIY